MAHDLEKKWRSKDVKTLENADFEAMLLCDRVLSGLAKAGFKKPSPIQLEAIPVGRFGKDLLVQAKSGTGKTLVFVIVALEMLRRKLFRPQVLILVPTREIATQICSVVKTVGSSFSKLRCESFIGGLPVADDINKAHNCQIAVGTPGRIKQLINLKALSTSSIRLMVFDEADELLAYSWQEDIDAIFNSLPEDKQVIAASATYPPKLKKQMFRYLRDPYVARLNSEKLTLLGIIHYAKIVESSAMPLKQYDLRLAALEPILKTLKFTQCLVYCNGIHKVEALHRDIKKWGFSSAYISSDRDQSERLKAIECFKRFKCKILVSSDVTARGIDAENLDLVVNFDISKCIETYLHRSGRAGRFGTIGVTITLLDKFEMRHLKQIEEDAHFKSYILPDPLPVDLIQNPSPEKYVIAIVDEDNVLEDEVENKSVKRTNGLLNWRCASEEEIEQSETKTKCSLDISSDHCNVVSEKQNGFLKPVFIERSNATNGTSESKHLSIVEKTQGTCHKICDSFIDDSLKNSSSCEDLTGSKKSSEVQSISVSKSEISNEDGLDKDFLEPGSLVNSDTSCQNDVNSVVMNECCNSDVSNISSIENVCDVKLNKEQCDINAKVSADQIIENQNVECCFHDASSSNPCANETGFNLYENEMVQAIETFVNNFETCRSRKTAFSKSEILTVKDSCLTGNSENTIITTSYINDLNSRRSDYHYKVFKLFQEDNMLNSSESKMKDTISEEENASLKNELHAKENLSEVINEKKFPSLQDITNQPDFMMASDLTDKLKLENTKELADSSAEENAAIPQNDIPNCCAKTRNECGPHWDKSKYKITTLLDRTYLEKPEKNSVAFFKEMSEESSSEADSNSGVKSSSDTDQYSLSESETESSSDSSSLTSSSFEDDSSDEYGENYDRESLNGNRELSFRTSSVKKFMHDKEKIPINYNHMSSNQPSTRSKRNKQPCQYAYQRANHSRHLSANAQHLSSHMRTCQHANNPVHFPCHHHPRNSISSDCKHHVSRIKHNVPHKRTSQEKNHSCCLSDLSQHSSTCFMPSEHRCHQYNDSTMCNQRAICAQWYQTFYNQWLHIQRHSYFTF